MLIFLLVALPKAIAQPPQPPAMYKGTLVAYLTEINTWLEGQMLLNYCNCADNPDFIYRYHHVRAKVNASLNNYILAIGLERPRKVAAAFDNINSNAFLHNNAILDEAYKSLEAFGEFDASSCGEKTFLPTAITVAELLGVANAATTAMNEADKRREAQRLLIIQTLENLKIPSSNSYSCQ